MVSGIGGVSGAYCAQDLAAMREKMFKKADTDGDGKLSKAEMQTAAEQMQQMGPPPGGPPDASEIAKDMFSDADSDGDGSITADDLAGILSKDGKGPSADEIFEAADSDGDGKISQSDLQSALESIFEKHKGDAPPPPPPSGYSADGNATYQTSTSSLLSTTA
jgi:hypothetical protein